MDAPSQINPYDELGHLYDEWCTEVAEDIPFYEALADAEAARLGGDPPRVLELGAGSGRITLRLAARGCSVVALDTSESQLDRLAASARAEGVHERVECVLGDMRDLGNFVAPESMDLVVSPFRSLLHVADARTPIFRRAYEVLRPGGCLAFDVFHPNHAEAEEVGGRWVLRRRWRADGGTWSIWERATFDIEGGTLDLDVRCEFTPSPGSTREAEKREAHMRLLTPPPQAWHEALESCGFELERVHGWFDDSEWHPGDVDSIWVARRPD